MANAKISELTAYTAPISTDVLPIVDVTAVVTKKIAFENVIGTRFGSSASPGSASTQTITHNLGRIPNSIRLFRLGDSPTSGSNTTQGISYGLYNASDENICYWIPSTAGGYGAVLSTSYAISVNGITNGVVGNLTSTTFDIVWTDIDVFSFIWEAN